MNISTETSPESVTGIPETDGVAVMSADDYSEKV